MTFCDNLLKSFSENLKQLTKMNDFLLYLHFHENRRFCTVFMADINSACKNTLSKTVYLLNFHRSTISANFAFKGHSLAILPVFSKFENF